MESAVGVALVLAAALGRGTWRCRALAGASGAAWSIGSVPELALLHQGLLLVLLVTFPSGAPGGRVHRLLVAAAVPVALLLLPQPAVAALFAAAAAASLPDLRDDPAARAFPLLAGSGVAAVLGSSWAVSRLAPAVFDPAAALRAYEIVLLGVAAGFVLASRAVVADRAGWTDRLLPDDRRVDLDGLAEVLAETLHDPRLRITGPDDPPPAQDGTGARQVRDGHRTVAVVRSGSPALEDASVATAVDAAVRLVVSHQQRRQELQERTERLRRARSRIVAAADRQRTAMASRLQAEVLDPLARTASTLSVVGGPPQDPAEAEAVTAAARELAVATEEIRRLVAGVPPTALGGGRLRAAVDELAARSPVPVTVSGTATGEPDVEAALFYVCSEALVNAGKHARARHVAIVLTEDRGFLRLTIADDGRGGADPDGSGIRGLADRLAVHGGRLRVESPPGAGTTVTAIVPR